MGKKTTIGVLVGVRTLEDLLGKVGSYRLNSLIRANVAVGADLFFFLLTDVDLGRRTIRGHCLDGDTWRTKTYSYPRVFYRRYTIPPYQKRTFKTFIHQLQSRDTIFLNYQFVFDKWELHQVLSADSSVQQHLPETRLVGSLTQVVQMLDRYSSLYLKACGGGRGREVMKVEKLRDGSYIYSYYRNELHRGKTTRASLLDQVDQFFGKGRFVAQEAIDLLQVEGRNIDFRAEVQPGPEGPQAPAIPVRIARYKSPITTHATSMSMDRFLEAHPTVIPDPKAFKQRAEEFVLSIFQALEKGYGYGAEVGIDFGVDKTEKFWLIECNAQSAKVSLFNSYSPQEVDQTFVNLLMYAVAKATE